MLQRVAGARRTLLALPAAAISASAAAAADPGLQELPEDEREVFWVFGIVLTLVGQTVCVAGLQLQKISHATHTPTARRAGVKRTESLLDLVSSPTSLDEAGDLEDYTSPYFTKWRWVMGGLVWATGHITCWFALGLAPQSILACLQSWNILVNFALAPFILGEEIPPHAGKYSMLLVGGCTLVVMFGPRPDTYRMETVSTLTTAFFALPSVVVHAVCLGLVAVLRSVPEAPPDRLRVERNVATSAISAWYAALCSKSMSMLVITSVSMRSPGLEDLGFFVFVGLFVLFAVGQIHFMNMALKYGLACSVIPMYEGMSLTGQVLFGGVLFREFQDFTRGQQFGFWPGILLVLLGLCLLVRGVSSDDPAAAAPLPGAVGGGTPREDGGAEVTESSEAPRLLNRGEAPTPLAA